MESQLKRYDWVDVMKFFGIFMVFLHHTKSSGYLAPYIFAFTAELFFFTAGFFAGKKLEMPFWAFLKLRAKQLLLPYFFFLAVYFIVMSLDTSTYHPGLEKSLLQGVLGMRSYVFVAALWFLPCIFAMNLIYYFFNKVFRNRERKIYLPVLFLFAFALNAGAFLLTPHLPYGLPFSFNYAMRFFLFYAAGSVLFPFLKNLKLTRLARLPQALVAAFSIFAVFYIISGFSNHIFFRSILEACAGDGYLNWIFGILNAFLMIAGFLVVSKMMDTPNIFATIGRDTLMLCGTEQLSGLLLSGVFAILFGRARVLATPFDAFLWAGVLLAFAAFVLVPFFKSSFPAVFDAGRKNP